LGARNGAASGGGVKIMICFLFISVLALGLVGCAENEPMSVITSGKDNFVQFPIGGETPQPTRSEYFITKGGGFALRLDEQHNLTNCCYALFLKPRKEIVAPLYLRTKFQNPTNCANPIVLDTEIPPDSTNVMIQSPDIRGFQSGRSYLIDVSIFDSPERSKTIGVHDQFIQYIKPPNVK
jgi:hypothetical protein